MGQPLFLSTGAVRQFLLVVFLAVGCVAADIHAEEKPSPAAEWIWTAGSRDATGVIYLRKTFTLNGDVTRGTCQIAADFAHLKLTLNGKRCGEVENYSSAREFAITPLLKSGENELRVEAHPSQGPSAIAATIQLTFADGRSQTIVTDATWQTSGASGESSNWTAAKSWGNAAADSWTRTTNDAAVSPFDDYQQWQQALGTKESADPSKFLVPAGFEIELLRAAREGEGSWIGLACDPQGRLLIGREDQGLLRVTLRDKEVQVTPIDLPLKECRGVLWAHDSVYVSANSSNAVYRLRDLDGDDTFEKVERLFELPGGGGHGRNSLALGPDRRVYLISGDSVPMPKDLADRTSPFSEHRHLAKSNDGFLLAFDADGGNREIMTVGLRNPYGIAFNPAGDAFTYDADAEKDMGQPWYRPTRVNHLVPGADFGWRGVTGSWPAYYPDHPDNGLPNLDIGKGSPTAVMFGTASRFPAEYRRNLFILDWSYGRIVRVDLTHRGASYVGHAETFVKGRPFNVTSLTFGPDGAMYVVTGGRKTQSGLYRIRYLGADQPEASRTPQQLAREEYSTQAHALRRKLERGLGTKSHVPLDEAWPYLDHADPWVRHAARIAVEQHPLATWQDRALREENPRKALTALLALARAGDAKLSEPMITRLNQLPLKGRTSTEKETFAYIVLLAAQAGELSQGTKEQTAALLLSFFPDDSSAANSLLSRALAKLQAPAFVEKGVEQLEVATTQEERLHYLYVLRDLQTGWTPALRDRYFANLANARGLSGGEGLPRTYQRIVEDALKALPENERPRYEAQVTAKPTEDDAPLVNQRPFVRMWQPDDVPALLANKDHRPDLSRGKEIFAAALCIRCHRFGLAGSSMGPDLTAVARRFSRRDILESILLPSKVVAEQYRTMQITTNDGRVISGRLVAEEDFRTTKLHIATNPLDPRQVVEVKKSDIESYVATPLSSMPEGLLNSLTQEEIWDLLAYLETAGVSRK